MFTSSKAVASAASLAWAMGMSTKETRKDRAVRRGNGLDWLPRAMLRCRARQLMLRNAGKFLTDEQFEPRERHPRIAVPGEEPVAVHAHVS